MSAALSLQSERRLAPGPAAPARPEPLHQAIGREVWAGVLLVLLVLGAGLGWAAVAPLSGAAIAPGVVGPEGSRRTVQHLEGGIIQALHVKDGDSVETGSPLLELDPTQVRAEVAQGRSRLRTLLAIEARLQAERAQAESIAFDHPMLAERDNPHVAAAIAQQQAQFETRAANDASRAAILAQRVAQLDQQIVGYRKQIESVSRQRALIQEEIAGVRQLFEKGLERKPRLLALQRAQAELLGIEGDLTARIARAEEAIGETNLQVVNLRVERAEEVDAELAKVQAERRELEERLKAAVDRLARTQVAAPIAGTVLSLRFKTLGGVIRAGEPILEIVPREDELVIEARLAPGDIDQVAAGQPAYVMFPSYPQRRMLRIEGSVARVSADALVEEKTGDRYYQVLVGLDRAHLAERAPDLALVPGLPAEVYIETTSRTLLEYLVQPLLQALERSFREG